MAELNAAPLSIWNWNTTALVTTAGVVVERYMYSPYGVVNIRNGNWSLNSNPGGSYDWVYLHQGGRWNAAAGTYHFRHRDYSPTLGRWMNQDPLGYVDGGNLYEYVRSGPTGSVDPRGLKTTWTVGAAPGAASIGWIESGTKAVVGPVRYGLRTIGARLLPGDEIGHTGSDSYMARLLRSSPTFVTEQEASIAKFRRQVESLGCGDLDGYPVALQDRFVAVVSGSTARYLIGQVTLGRVVVNVTGTATVTQRGDGRNARGHVRMDITYLIQDNWHLHISTGLGGKELYEPGWYRNVVSWSETRTFTYSKDCCPEAD